MIEENPSSSGEENAGIQIPFDASLPMAGEAAVIAAEQTAAQVADIVKPNGVNVLLRLDQLPTMHGGIHLPQAMKSLEFVTATVLAKGPECKFVNVKDRVLVAYKAIINQQAGIPLEGVKLHFTQENLVIAVVGREE